jgi:hypothetical protein
VGAHFGFILLCELLCPFLLQAVQSSRLAESIAALRAEKERRQRERAQAAAASKAQAAARDAAVEAAITRFIHSFSFSPFLFSRNGFFLQVLGAREDLQGALDQRAPRRGRDCFQYCFSVSSWSFAIPHVKKKNCSLVGGARSGGLEVPRAGRRGRRVRAETRRAERGSRGAID